MPTAGGAASCDVLRSKTRLERHLAGGFVENSEKMKYDVHKLIKVF